MKKYLTKEQERQTLEARCNYLHQLEGEFKGWSILSEEEEKRMKSLLRSINKYIECLEK